MEERENKVTELRDVKLVMCIAHDQDTCHILNGEFRAKAATRFAANPHTILSTIYNNNSHNY